MRPSFFIKIGSADAMNTKESEFRIDGLSYKIADLSDEGRNILQQLIFIRTNLLGLRNQQSLLSRAKNGYIEDLKSEVIEKKSGVDLGALFMDD